MNPKIDSLHEIPQIEERKVRIERIVFYNEINSYTVFSCIDIDTKNPEMFTAVGEMPPEIEGREFRIKGTFRQHPNYGEQFVIHEFHEELPTSKEGIENFLSSGIFPGIGEKRAAAIVAHFGADAVKILRETPEKLAEIPGMSKKKAKLMGDIFQAEMQFFEIFAYLGGLGISVGQSMQIYKTYGESSVKIIEENPYVLAGMVANIGFRRADTIARKLDMTQDDPRRIRAGVLYILRLALRDGDSYLAEREVEERTANLLDVQSEKVSDALIELAYNAEIKKEIINGQAVVYLMRYFEAEQSVATNLVRIATSSESAVSGDIDGMIARAEASRDMLLSSEQRASVRGAVSGRITVITGGPGTGKTTVINCIVEVFKQCGLNVAIAAPTGRAAKRISETGGFDAVTIHRLLEYSYSHDDEYMHFGRDSSNPIEADALIVDEASMIDILLMEALLDAVTGGTYLIFVGDIDQLPPVGAGNTLRDMIDSEIVPVFELTEIFRQVANSKIIVNAHMINRGEYIDCSDRAGDFYFIHRTSEKDIADLIAELCSSRLPAFFPELDPMRDIQVLTPQRKSLLGCNELNLRLQNVMNPGSGSIEKLIGNRIFRVGDKVMQVKNNYDMELKNAHNYHADKGVFNGDLGFISSIDEDRHLLHVRFYDDRIAEYPYIQSDELEHSYAITVHKSQGSEFPVVVIPISRIPPMLATRNLIYTAITRGKNSVVMVGDERYLKYMIDNKQLDRRSSGLTYRLKSTYSLMREFE